MAPADIERFVLLSTKGCFVVQPAEEQRNVGRVLERLHPSVQRLLEMLGGHMISAECGQSGGVFTHLSQRGPRLVKVGPFGGKHRPTVSSGHAVASDLLG
jgi:hypothetical protein